MGKRIGFLSLLMFTLIGISFAQNENRRAVVTKDGWFLLSSIDSNLGIALYNADESGAVGLYQVSLMNVSKGFTSLRGFGLGATILELTGKNLLDSGAWISGYAYFPLLARQRWIIPNPLNSL